MRFQKSARAVAEKPLCYHCGDACSKETVLYDEKTFCCNGCRTVYELLLENQLCDYYDFSQAPGISPGSETGTIYSYLDNESIKEKLIAFREGRQAQVIFYIPTVHCSSCIWLLENLSRFNTGIISSVVNFPKKEVTIRFDEQTASLSQLAGLLSATGYAPSVHLEDMDRPVAAKRTNAAVARIGVAGFCFGNIMMLSFPEYFSFGNFHGQEGLRQFFAYLNLALALPVFLYSAVPFFSSSLKSLRHRFLNIDLPITLAILVTFFRSVYEIVSGTGTGYLDSMTGIVFFMLLGRYFQGKTYDTLSFDRDYKSYFPIAVEKKTSDAKNAAVPISELVKGDIIVVRNNELIPADALLLSPATTLDYSFITGESSPVEKEKGELIYAGAKQLAGAVELEIVRPVSQSYLTGLWNSEDKKDGQTAGFVDVINKWFTVAVLIIAFSAAGYWLVADPGKALNAFTAVLIVACPCGLLLTTSFANGNLLRIFGRNKFYLKNASVIDELAKADTVIFDKTGTITCGTEATFESAAPDKGRLDLAVSLAAQSAHPLSRAICHHYSESGLLPVSAFREIPGTGIEGMVAGHSVYLGSGSGFEHTLPGDNSTRVFLRVDGQPAGSFRFANAWREELPDVIRGLSPTHSLEVLSGDKDSQRETLRDMFGEDAILSFDRRPDEKRSHIKTLREHKRQVIMVGDGLNDAGALGAANVGIAVSDDTNIFSPACDAILDGAVFGKLPQFIALAKDGKRVIQGTFIFSLAYNIIGLAFAVRGTLSPVIAAILMPASTISIVLLTTVGTNLSAALRGMKAFGKN